MYDNVEAAQNTLDYTQSVIEPDVNQVDSYEIYYRQVYRKLYLALSDLHHNIYELSHKHNNRG